MVRKSPRRRSPAGKSVLALHAVPLRQIGPRCTGVCDALATDHCGWMNVRRPFLHVTQVPCALSVSATYMENSVGLPGLFCSHVTATRPSSPATTHGHSMSPSPAGMVTGSGAQLLVLRSK